MVTKTDRKMERTRRHIRVRTKISGTPERPRLCIYKSNNNNNRWSNSLLCIQNGIY